MILFRIHPPRWAELESGDTTLAFTALEQRETYIVGGVHPPTADEQRPNLEIGINVADVENTFQVSTLLDSIGKYC